MLTHFFSSLQAHHINIMKKNTVLFFILNMTFSSNMTQTVNHFYFQQELDHFNPFDHQKWNQNYWVMATYYRKTGPAFLFVNGENSVNENTAFEMQNTTLLYAQKLNAICFSLEHRFYSKTPPVNGSIMNHLSIAQALADIENFIKGKYSVTKEFHLPKHINWILFGCSYAGTLAAWARLKYPHLIFGAVASSAALLAKVDYYEYYQIVEESLKSYDSKCVESITLAFKEVANLIISPQNIEDISQMFYIDEDLLERITNVKKYIIYLMMKILGVTVQYNDPRKINIPLVCTIMNKHDGTKLEALAEIGKIYMGYHKNMQSNNNEDRNIANNEFRHIWIYQRCSELGRFRSFTNTTFSSSMKHLFTPIETEIEIKCARYFGSNFSVKDLNETVSRTNLVYGGLDFNMSNTIFIHGSLDPWYKAGIYKKSKSSPYETIFINGTSHCADTNLVRDGPELKKARYEVLDILKSWLKKKST